MSKEKCSKLRNEESGSKASTCLNLLNKIDEDAEWLVDHNEMYLQDQEDRFGSIFANIAAIRKIINEQL